MVFIVGMADGVLMQRIISEIDDPSFGIDLVPLIFRDAQVSITVISFISEYQARSYRWLSSIPKSTITNSSHSQGMKAFGFDSKWSSRRITELKPLLKPHSTTLFNPAHQPYLIVRMHGSTALRRS